MKHKCYKYEGDVRSKNMLLLSKNILFHNEGKIMKNSNKLVLKYLSFC
jgi:hypothetical protein